MRTRAIPERLRGVFTTRRYTNPRLPLPYLDVRTEFDDHFECEQRLECPIVVMVVVVSLDDVVLGGVATLAAQCCPAQTRSVRRPMPDEDRALGPTVEVCATTSQT